MQRFKPFFICLLGLFVASIASIALGQVGTDPALVAEAIESTTDGKLLGWLATGIPLLVVICSALSSAFPSTNKVMGVVDFFAINWLKARNDPDAQTWGE